MPKLATEQTIQIAPELQLELEAKLSTIELLLTDLDALQEQIDAEYKKFGAELDLHDLTKFKASNGTSAYWNRGGVSSRLVKEKLIAQGVTLAQIEAATVTKPKRDSFTIRRAKDKGNPAEE